MSRRPSPARRAFTLVEAIAAIVVLATAGSLAASVMTPAIDSAIAASLTADLEQTASLAMDRLVVDLRETEAAPAGGPAFARVTSTHIIWSDGREALRRGDRLHLVEAGVPHLLARSVESFAIRAFASDGSVLPLPLDEAGCTQIRRIELALVLARGGVRFPLRTRIAFRTADGGAD